MIPSSDTEGRNSITRKHLLLLRMFTVSGHYKIGLRVPPHVFHSLSFPHIQLMNARVYVGAFMNEHLLTYLFVRKHLKTVLVSHVFLTLSRDCVEAQVP